MNSNLSVEELELLMRKHAMTVNFSVLWGSFTATGVQGVNTVSHSAITLAAAVCGLDQIIEGKQ